MSKAKLKDLCLKIGSGATPKGGNNVYLDKGNYSLIRSQNIYNEGFSEQGIVYISDADAKKLENVDVKEDDVLINITGDSVARVSLPNKKYLPARVNQHVSILRANPEKLDFKFLKYVLVEKSMQEYLLTLASSGATRNALTKAMLENIEIDLPSLNDQKRISNFLLKFDEKIQLNTQINQTLEQIAQTLFKSWFVDFDPVRAKVQALSDGLSLEQAELAAMQAISGKTPEELTALSQTQPDRYAELAETAKAFPCEMVEVDEVEMPKGWNISTIGQEVETVGGATPSTKEEKFWNNGEIAWTTPKDLSSATSPVLLKTERKITESGLKKISSGLFPIGTVLLSSRAPVGYLSLAQIPVAINQGYIAIKCNKSLNNYYMLQWCKENLEEIKGRASGTTFLEISKTTFRQIPIIVPDGNILSLFEKQCSSIYQSITINTKENINLEKTRDLLLPRLLNGEI